MNVLYIVGGEGNRYGSEIIAIDLIESGTKRGINYTVVTANEGAVSKACAALGVECHVIPFRFFVYKAMENVVLNYIKKGIWKLRAEYLTKRAIKKIESCIDLKQIDLIHTNLSRDLLGGEISSKHKIPHIWHIHELVKTHYELTFLRNNQIEWMTQHADCFIAISNTVAGEWIQAGLTKEKVRTVVNGIDLSNISSKKTYLESNILKLVMVGHLVPAKGQLAIIRKLSKLPDHIRKNVRLDCYGEGSEEYKKHMVTIASDLDVQLSLKGYKTTIGSELKNYDIGVNCSKGEGFGLSTIEFMAAGICPLVANTGANEEIITNQKNGYVFDYESDVKFVDTITYLFNNREEMIEVSKRAREEAVLKYSRENMQKEIFNQYKAVAERNKNV